ncbi:hypothetical protein ST201phi2-1p040 [Pseudomonas phage 201phi2-1]|uniref:Uncharacterized protein n=1 Tax=Pseudomonas phage 201phi2-1 TaxID=198110 RepID=B3FK15_BP201|nr:hypothetical protein ST201phi2-1p040 [Pseudomonas phage 201phi2-1]ABY62873.1 hypothetical protein 201phi2-1p040 [Pseudomonas phage 201phi2-1]
MIGSPGFLRQAELITYLNQNTEYEELEFIKHEFLPDRWCIGNTVKGHWVQIAVVHDGKALEIDYMLDGQGHRTMAVFDTESVAKRALAYLRAETSSI